MEKSSKINYQTRPVPSSPGAQQITVDGLASKKGSGDFVSKMPTKNVVPGDSSKSGKAFSKS